VLAIAILAYLARSGIIEWSRLRGMASAWRYTASALLLLIVGFAIMSWRACALFAPRGLRLSFADSMRLTLVGNAANLVLPLIGSDMVRILFTARGQVGRKTEIATVILLERVVGLVGILALPIVAAPFFTSFISQHATIRLLVAISALGVAALAVPTALALSRRIRESGFVRGLLRRFPLRGIPERILDTLHGYRHAPTVLLRALALSVAANALVMIAVMLLHAAMHTGSIQPLTAFLASLGAVSNNFPLTPGGIGVAEAAYESIFRIAGLTGGAEALIGSRVLFLALAPVGIWIYFRGVRPALDTSEARVARNDASDATPSASSPRPNAMASAPADALADR
jgi:uncharacterized membrane protein YbhN (UPF0104 family)